MGIAWEEGSVVRFFLVDRYELIPWHAVRGRVILCRDHFVGVRQNVPKCPLTIGVAN